MKNSAMQLIKTRIDELPLGKAFVVSDFTDITDYENAKKCLLRLEKESLIRRVIRGIYDKPYYSNLLKEYSAPDIEEIAKAIARNYSWEIAPSGLTSLNLLGLSTQVNNLYEYYSSGQYKTYIIGKITIYFKHKASKELFNLSYKASLIVQAIKEIGNDIDLGTINKIKSRLTKAEKGNILIETKGVTKWIYEIIKKICFEKE